MADPLTTTLCETRPLHLLPIRVQITLTHTGVRRKLFLIPPIICGSAEISLLLEGSDCHEVSEVKGETFRVIIRLHHDLIPVLASREAAGQVLSPVNATFVSHPLILLACGHF